MRIAFFYFAAFICLMGAIAAIANTDYVSAFILFALFLGLPLFAKMAA